MDELRRRAALVTGAGRRIGRAIALDLAGAGWTVAVHYNTSAADADAVVTAIREAGGNAVAVGADLTEEDAAEGLIDAAVDAVGPLECLINNAAIFEYDDPATATRDTWWRHQQVNLRAPFVLIQGFAAQLPEGRDGAVVNMIDQRVWNLTGSFTSYTVSKAGLWALTQSLALALAPRIRVNAIGPGPTLPSTRQTEAHFEHQWRSLPLARQVTPEEICAAVRFILDAPAMTGQMIALDGGQHLGWAVPGASSPPE